MEELDLKELLSLFWSKIFQIIVIVLITTGVGIIYTYGFTTPKYSSSTTLVLTGSEKTAGTARTTITYAFRYSGTEIKEQTKAPLPQSSRAHSASSPDGYTYGKSGPHTGRRFLQTRYPLLYKPPSFHEMGTDINTRRFRSAATPVHVLFLKNGKLP